MVRLRYRLELQTAFAESDKQKMVAELDAVDRLIDEMLVYARLEQPTPQLEWEEWEVMTWLQQLVKQQWQPLSATIRIQLALPDGELRWQGDKRLITRALDNLVTNGLRYAQRQLRVSLLDQPGVAGLCIEEDGPGIPPDAREQVFEPFTRLDPSRDRHTGGCGLGLAIVDGIVRAHQGEIALDASPLGGARFILRWPLTPMPTVHTVTNRHLTPTDADQPSP